MKRVIQGSEYINAMAIINPRLCKERSVQIEIEQRNEGPIPHLHVYLDKTRNPQNCAYIRLDKAEYAPHHISAKMSRQQKKDFIEILTAIAPKQYTVSIINGEERHATGYQNAVEIWIETYGETVNFPYDDEGFPQMPDYSNL